MNPDPILMLQWCLMIAKVAVQKFEKICLNILSTPGNSSCCLIEPLAFLLTLQNIYFHDKCIIIINL